MDIKKIAGGAKKFGGAAYNFASNKGGVGDVLEKVRKFRRLKMKLIIAAALIVTFFVVLLFLGIADFFGYKISMAEETGGIANVPKERYEFLEDKSYDHTYSKDEIAFKLPWAVMAEADSRIYPLPEGKEDDPNAVTIAGGDTQEAIDRRAVIYNALKAEYKGDYIDQDTIYTYECKKRQKQNPDGTYVLEGGFWVYELYWDPVPIKTDIIPRHIIPTAITWEGTVSRSYLKVEFGEQPPISQAKEGDTYQTGTIWDFDQTCVYDYAKFDNFLKSKDPQIYQSDLDMAHEIIYTVLNIPMPTANDEYYIYGGVYGPGELAIPIAGIADFGQLNITSSFGYRTLQGVGGFHHGIDIAVPVGTDIVACGDGEIIFAGWQSSDPTAGYGQYIILHTGDKFIWYGHLSQLNVSTGQQVTAGQIIGKSGNTGHSTGPHLHFEVRVGPGSTIWNAYSANAVDPKIFLIGTSGGVASPSGQAFINSILPGAIEGYNKYGVLPSITLAQAALESGWGVYHMGGANNLFGIKAGSSWTGQTVTVPTKEQSASGAWSIEMATFRAYPSFVASVEDHGHFLAVENSRYRPVINSTDFRQAAVALQQCGYATDLNYPQKLINLIVANGWAKYDTQGTTTVPNADNGNNSPIIFEPSYADITTILNLGGLSKPYYDCTIKLFYDAMQNAERDQARCINYTITYMRDGGIVDTTGPYTLDSFDISTIKIDTASYYDYARLNKYNFARIKFTYIDNNGGIICTRQTELIPLDDNNHYSLGLIP